MPTDQLIQIPFLLDLRNLQADKIIIFIVSVLAAVTVNAEGQAVMATMLGDAQRDSKDRFNFNPLFHLDIPGVLCFVIAGFGWPRTVYIDSTHFKHPNAYLILSRFAGPFANLFLAGIAGSILFMMHSFDLEDQVFSIVMSVNLMTFVFSFLPIPPLAGVSLFAPLLPKGNNTTAEAFTKISPYLLVFAFIIVRFYHIELLNAFLYPIVRLVFRFLAG